MKSTIELLKCPKCEKEFEFNVWDTINVTVNPEDKKKLLNNEFFMAVCPDCNDRHDVIYPCLYHDMNNSLMFWFIPNGKKSDIAMINESLENIENTSQKTRIGEFYDDLKYDNLRCVFNLFDLKEKIYINDQNLDDRIIEIMKTLILASMINEKIENVDFSTTILFSSLSNENGQEMIVFTRKSGEEFISFSVERSIYDSIIINYADIIPKKQKQYMLIDRQWALNILSK